MWSENNLQTTSKHLPWLFACSRLTVNIHNPSINSYCTNSSSCFCKNPLALSRFASSSLPLIHVSAHSCFCFCFTLCWLPQQLSGKRKIHRTMQETREMWVWFLGWEGSPGEKIAIHSSNLCLENSMDRGAWRALVHWASKNQTWLSIHAQYFMLIFVFPDFNFWGFPKNCYFLYSCTILGNFEEHPPGRPDSQNGLFTLVYVDSLTKNSSLSIQAM